MNATTHEIVRPMTSGQLKDLITTLTGAAPADLTFSEAEYLGGKKGLVIDRIQGAVQSVLAEAPPTIRATAVPLLPLAESKVFELTLDGETRVFKLVQIIGPCSTKEEVQEKLRVYGDTPADGWLKVYEAAYPRRPREAIAVANLSISDYDGNIGFRFIGGETVPMFSWGDGGLHSWWWWLVFAEQPEVAG